MTRGEPEFLPSRTPTCVQRADAATLLCAFVIITAVIPTFLRFDAISVSPSDLAGMGLSVVALCAYLTHVGMARGRSPVRTAVVVYALSLLLSYGYAAYGYLPVDEIKALDHKMVVLVSLLGVTLLACDGVRGRQRLDLLLKAVTVAGAYVAFAAVLQFFFKISLVSPFGHLPGMSFLVDPLPTDTQRGAFIRATGTAGTPIELGVLCVMVLPLAAHYGFQARTRGRSGWVWWACCLLLAAALFFSLSRAALLGLAAAGLPLLITWPARRRIGVVAVGAVFLAGIWVAVPGLLGTILHLFTFFSKDSSISYREHDYPVAIAEMSRHVWFGRGPGTWYAPKHQIFDNQYLVTLVECGVLGLLAFLGLFATCLYAGIRSRMIASDEDTRDLAVSLVSALVVPVVGAMTFDLLSFALVTAFLFVLLGAVGALHRAVVEERRTVRRRRRRRPVPRPLSEVRNEPLPQSVASG